MTASLLGNYATVIATALAATTRHPAKKEQLRLSILWTDSLKPSDLKFKVMHTKRGAIVRDQVVSKNTASVILSV